MATNGNSSIRNFLRRITRSAQQPACWAAWPPENLSASSAGGNVMSASNSVISPSYPTLGFPMDFQGLQGS